MAALNQSPGGVGVSRLLMWSMAPLAAEKAELALRAAITAAPRFCTAGTNVLSSHARSVITSVARRPLIFALVKSGNWVLLWLPQMVTQVTASSGTPAFLASMVRARL